MGSFAPGILTVRMSLLLLLLQSILLFWYCLCCQNFRSNCLDNSNFRSPRFLCEKSSVVDVNSASTSCTPPSMNREGKGTDTLTDSCSGGAAGGRRKNQSSHGEDLVLEMENGIIEEVVNIDGKETLEDYVDEEMKPVTSEEESLDGLDEDTTL